MQVPSQTTFQTSYSTSVLPESIWQYLVRHTYPTTLSCLEPWCYCLALHRIPCPPSCCLHWLWEYPSSHACWANYQCPQCIVLHYSHHFCQDESWFSVFGGHLIHQSILQGGPFQIQLVAKEIILTIYIQLHHHVENLTRMHCQSLQYVKCDLWLSFVCCEPKSPSE